MEKTEKNKTWQEHVADDVLAIAVAIKVRGAGKHFDEIGMDAALQAAGMAYCSERARHHWGKEDERNRIADALPTPTDK